MSTKKTFRIKLDTEFTIDFENWDLSEAQLNKIEYFKTMILDEYLAGGGYEEFEVTANQPISLFEMMADMFNPNKK